MSESTLRRFLAEKTSDGCQESSAVRFTINPVRALSTLGSFHTAGDPGLWAVKWVQAAVAAGAERVHLAFKGCTIEASCHGPIDVSAHRLLQAMMGGQTSADRATRHWVTALRGLYGQQGADLCLVSRQGERQQTVRVESRRVAEVSHRLVSPKGAALTLEVRFPRSFWNWPSVGGAEYRALSSRLRFCPVPVFLGGRLLSRQSPFRESRVIYTQIEQARQDEPAFTLFADPSVRLAPNLADHSLWGKDALGRISPGLQSCNLMLILRMGSGAAGSANVYWMRDGALLGPVPLTGGLRGAHLDIVCPGDPHEVDFSEWALREPQGSFSDQAVLAAVRHMTQSLKSRLRALTLEGLREFCARPSLLLRL